MPKKHLATVSILVKDRQIHAGEVQDVLTENAHMIFARLGVNVQRHCIEHCTGYIVVVVEGTKPEIAKLVKKLDSLYGIVSKACVMTE
jgi:metal-responsive CopG/Arc/MetJ family transcriptional regulator